MFPVTAYQSYMWSKCVTDVCQVSELKHISKCKAVSPAPSLSQAKVSSGFNCLPQRPLFNYTCEFTERSELLIIVLARQSYRCNHLNHILSSGKHEGSYRTEENAFGKMPHPIFYLKSNSSDLNREAELNLEGSSKSERK